MEDSGDGNHLELFYATRRTSAFTMREKEVYESSEQRSAMI